MRDCGLGKFDSLFDVGGAKPSVLSQRASTSFFKRAKDPATGRVSDRLQKTIERCSRLRHKRRLSDLGAVRCALLFHNRVIAIGDQPGFHGVSFFKIGVRSNLYMIVLVGRGVIGRERRVLLFL